MSRSIIWDLISRIPGLLVTVLTMLTVFEHCLISLSSRDHNRVGVIIQAAQLKQPDLVSLSGLDGIRTRDLGLDRAACLATTPRDRASGSLLYIQTSVKPNDSLMILPDDIAF